MKRTVTIIEDERRTRLFRLPEGSRAEHQQLRKGLMVLGEGDIVVLPSQLHDPDATRSAGGRTLSLASSLGSRSSRLVSSGSRSGWRRGSTATRTPTGRNR